MTMCLRAHHFAVPDADASYGVGTTEYMRAQGGYAVTLECGQHADAAGPEVAYRHQAGGGVSWPGGPAAGAGARAVGRIVFPDPCALPGRKWFYLAEPSLRTLP